MGFCNFVTHFSSLYPGYFLIELDRRKRICWSRVREPGKRPRESWVFELLLLRMPSASTKPENRASPEAGDPLKQVIIVVEKKLRNLEKRKV